MPWGDSMPNRPPTKTLWLALESLYQCGDLRTESIQLCSNRCKVGNALSGFLLDLVYLLFQECGVKCASLGLFLRPLHLSRCTFNCCCDTESLVDPRLNVCLQDCFFASCCVHLFFQWFGLLHSRKPLSEGHHLHSPFDAVVLLPEFTHFFL